MKLKASTYKHYTRFHLSSMLDHFTISPDKRIMVVAGDNGAGKSSLLSSLFPGIVRQSDIGEGGFVERVWLHNGKTYVDTTREDTYSLLCDGVELNGNGGVRFQSALYAEHFGITDDMIKILTGQLTFTNMSTQQRQYWIMKLSQNSLQTLETTWRTIKDSIREQKTLRDYTATQLNSLSTDVDPIKLQAQIETHTAALTGLGEWVGKVSAKPVDVDKQFADLVTLRKAIRKVNQTVFVYREHDTANVIRALEVELKLIKPQLNEAIATLIQIPEDSSHEMEGIPDRKTCETQLSSLQQQMALFDGGLHYVKWHGLILSHSSEIFSVLDDLITYSYQTPDEAHQTRKQYAASAGRVDYYRVEVTKVRTLISQLNEKLKHKVTCPNCTHRFVEGIDEQDLPRLQVTEQTLITEGRICHKERQTLADAVEVLDNHQKAYQQLQHLLTVKVTALKGLLDTYPDAVKIKRLFSTIVNDLQQYEHYCALQQQERQYTIYLQLHDNNQSSQHQQLLKQRSVLESSISELQERQQTLESLLVKYQQIASDKQLQKTLWQTRREAVTILGNDIQQLNQQAINTAINQSVLDHRTTIAKCQQALGAYTTDQKRQKQLQADLAQYTEAHEVHQLAERTLNPRTGFIGHLYKQIIEEHIAHMNQLIKQVWSYPLTIHVPEGDLKYRFPIRVDGFERDDISEGSKGIREIIDLAFMLMMRQYLEVEEFPLVLDEFGSNLDAGHLSNVYLYLREWIPSQIFMISHHPEIMALFDDNMADFVVLRSNNLDAANIPPTANAIIQNN